MAASKITYIIGAGASAEAIPSVGEKFNKRFTVFCEILLSYSKKNYQNQDKARAFINQAIEELPKHYSVDTYARKLFFQDVHVYEAFKWLLSSYFLFEQLSGANRDIGISDSTLEMNFNNIFPQNRKRLDTRYDVVYAALLNESSKLLPENINFISWNYDVQFELSYCGFLNIAIQDAFDNLKVYPSSFGRKDEDVNRATFLKLNGTAGLMFKQIDSQSNISPYPFLGGGMGTFSKLDMDACLSNVEDNLKNKYSNDYESMLHFAWENKPEISNARRKAKEILKLTDILVVIGYSFPLYNRKVVKEILSELANQKIYLQVLPEDFESTSERLSTIAPSSVKIIQRKDLNQFFIPDEVIF